MLCVMSSGEMRRAQCACGGIYEQAVHWLVSDLQPVQLAICLVLSVFISVGGQRDFRCVDINFILFKYQRKCIVCFLLMSKQQLLQAGCLIFSLDLSGFMDIYEAAAALSVSSSRLTCIESVLWKAALCTSALIRSVMTFIYTLLTSANDIEKIQATTQGCVRDPAYIDDVCRTRILKENRSLTVLGAESRIYF